MGITKLDSQKFRLQIRRKGLTHDKVYESLDEAKAIQAILLGKNSSSIHSPSFLSAVQQYLDSVTYLSKKKNTQNTEKYRLKKLGNYFGGFECHAITKDEVYKYVALRMKQPKHASSDAIRNEVRALSCLFNFAMEKKWITENPAQNIRLKQPQNKVRRITSSASGSVLSLIAHKDLRMRFLARHIALVINTGARPGEWGAVRVEDLKLGDLSCVNFKDTKNGLERTVPLAPDSLQLVKSQLEERKLYMTKNSKIDSEYLFPNKSGNSFYAYSGALRDAKNRGLLPKGLRIHDGRHEFISTATEKGDMSDAMIMSLVGHKNPASMKKYQSLRNTHFISQVEKLSKSFRVPRLEELSKELNVQPDFIRDCFIIYRREHNLTGSLDSELLYSHEFRVFLDAAVNLLKFAPVR